MKRPAIFSDCTIRLAALFIMFAMLTGCTRNNGDIGNWFGRWQIMEITADGIPQEGYMQQYFLDFQNDVIKGIMVGPNGYDRDYRECWGTWSQPDDNTLVFDFSHHQDKETGIYTPFPGLHFPDDGPFPVSVSETSGNKCTLRYVAPDGTEFVYRLRKR